MQGLKLLSYQQFQQKSVKITQLRSGEGCLICSATKSYYYKESKVLF